MLRHPAVKFRGKVYVGGPYHADAIDVAFAGFTDIGKMRAYTRIAEGREDIVFGYACEDGSDWVDSKSQAARKRMYGFD